MNILLLGATGLIGSAAAARLAADEHEVIGLGRATGPAARRVAVTRWRAADLRTLTHPDDWLSHLTGIDAVVNCAGVLQDNARDSTQLVHADAPAALWAACARAGVRRVIQVSAIGEGTGLTRFSRSKRHGDEALMATGLDWVILRPSVVIGDAAYGGSALIRALAALPVVPRFPDAGPIDLVQLDDVVETIARLLAAGAPSRVELDLAGPQRLTVLEIVAAWRRWLGWAPAREVRVPAFLLALAWRVGDLIAWLGWRPPVRTTARRELARGAIGNSRAWREAAGIAPRSLGEALAARPATVQERWFARLYWLKPVAILGFASFWLTTGAVALGPGRERALIVLRATDLAPWAEPALMLGAVTDLVLGALILIRATARPALLAALGVILAYWLLGTWLVPSLWIDPLGPMLKTAPILVLNLVCLAILDDR